MEVRPENKSPESVEPNKMNKGEVRVTELNGVRISVTNDPPHSRIVFSGSREDILRLEEEIRSQDRDRDNLSDDDIALRNAVGSIAKLYGVERGNADVNEVAGSVSSIQIVANYTANAEFIEFVIKPLAGKHLIPEEVLSWLPNN